MDGVAGGEGEGAAQGRGQTQGARGGETEDRGRVDVGEVGEGEGRVDGREGEEAVD